LRPGLWATQGDLVGYACLAKCRFALNLSSLKNFAPIFGIVRVRMKILGAENSPKIRGELNRRRIVWDPKFWAARWGLDD
jgi:hypothetical protein